MKIIIDDKINEKCSQVAIASIEAYVKVKEDNEDLWKIIEIGRASCRERV